jgi:hypothetical protein
MDRGAEAGRWCSGSSAGSRWRRSPGSSAWHRTSWLPWREKALLGIDTALKDRSGDFLQGTLDTAMQRIGELTMANELP